MKIKRSRAQELTENCKANAVLYGKPWGWFFDTSGNARAEEISPTALYDYVFRTDSEPAVPRISSKTRRLSPAEDLADRVRIAHDRSWCPICGVANCRHTIAEREHLMGLFRGLSCIAVIEEQGWRSIQGPRHMKWTDCFKKGKRYAFAQNVTDDSDPNHRRAYTYIREGFPGRDSFGRHYWKHGDVIAYDELTPPHLLPTHEKDPS